ncbi:MAG: YkgJ family cysteine cluster protein [Candidatus Kryptoniota bacterium]
MNDLESFKESVLKEHRPLNKLDTFSFRCYKGISCFNKCCADVNIFLTPYDVIRLKNNLGISSEEFLEKYCIVPIDARQQYPIVMLRMNSDEGKSCPFLCPDGCKVYKDRPWACRMFPIGSGSSKEGSEEFFFIIEEPLCMGYYENKQWSIEEWMANQEVSNYSSMGELFKQIALHEYFVSGKQLNPAKLEMFYMVCYNIDKFREFVFESSFLKRFNIDEEIISQIKTSDVELLKFGFKWLKFSLFGEPTIRLKSDGNH